MLQHDIIWWIMDNVCAVTEHRAWHCYNDAPRFVQRVWRWSWGPWL